jgi:hypothetical protein
MEITCKGKIDKNIFLRFLSFLILKIVPGDVVVELNGVNTTGQTVAECNI